MTELSKDRVFGMYLGGAIGDALGMPVEKMTAKEIREKYGSIEDYIENQDHPWFKGVPPGTTTDDWQLTKAVAEAFIETRTFDMDAIARAHVRALENPAGWGPSTREAIERIKSGIHWRRSGFSTKENRGFGNGVAMKVSPIAAWLSLQPYLVYDMPQAIRSTLVDFAFMTHRTGLGVSQAFAQVSALWYCFWALDPPSHFFLPDVFIGLTRDMSVWGSHVMARAYREENQLHLELERLATLEIFQSMSFDEIFSGNQFSAHVSLPKSYAFFLSQPRCIDALYDVINAGGDTDSNGAIVGSLLGALNGSSIFPEHLIKGLKSYDEVVDTTDRFCEAFGIT